MDYDRPKKASCLKVRLIIAILTTFCPITCYISRQNLSMAIVSMVNEPSPIHQRQQDAFNSTSNPLVSLDAQLFADTSCPIEASFDASGQTKPSIIKTFGPKYDWKSSEKSLIFGAFFWTYVLFQIPAARLAEVVGAKWILATSAIGSSILSFASPWAASLNVYALVLVRALMGICQTALFPACYVLYAKWLPPVERSLAIPILNVGAYVGSIFASSLTGYFCEQERFGWEWAFYTPGALCALWFVLWLWQGANRPRDHRTISFEEIEYIESKMEIRNEGITKKKEISWIKLMKSRSIWALVAAMFSSNWSFTVVLILLPSYLNDILHIPPFKNGLINSIIYGLYCISSPIVGSGSTMMIETRAFGLTRLNTRKLFEGTALFGQALCFLALPLIGCDQTWVLSFLFLQIVLFSFVNGGEVHLPTELSVDFSGTIYAIGNCIGSSTGFLAPMLHGYIVTDPRSHAQWDTFFYAAALICLIGGLVFIIFGQNQLQDFSCGEMHESQLDICGPTGKSLSSFSLTTGPSFDQHQRSRAPGPPVTPSSFTRSTPVKEKLTRATRMDGSIQEQGLA